MAEVVNVYMHKNEGRLMAYVKDENGHKVVSYLSGKTYKDVV